MQQHFLELREKYPIFIYDKYEIIENDNGYKLVFTFEIPNLTKFEPIILIPKKSINYNIDRKYLETLVFHVGLIELVSYFKCTCSPNVIIKCGYLNDEQIEWFKDLYYNGLGEFLYKNNINISKDELMHITCTKESEELPTISYNGVGNLIPIGGGKDSGVSLELLKNETDINTCFIINPKEVTLKCAYTAGYDENKILAVKRTLDKRIIDLNKQGFLNGHTPFSALVAFLTYLCAYINNKKYIVLSNEASANEPTIPGTNINHQYSKTYEFENAFNNYTNKYFNIDIKYFSLLRPLGEIQIAKLFSKYKKYHSIFRSCNVGSKENPWKWCLNCPKCLFVYIMLGAFLEIDDLISIFGENLYQKEGLLPIFLELAGYSDTKPFECIGTIEEVRTALFMTIKKYKGELPYLLKYYKDNFKEEYNGNLLLSYNDENNLDLKFESIIKKAIGIYGK